MRFQSDVHHILLSLVGEHIRISGKGVCVYMERRLGAGMQKIVGKGTE